MEIGNYNFSTLGKNKGVFYGNEAEKYKAPGICLQCMMEYDNKE